MSRVERWRGLKSLVVDAVAQASAAIERLQVETARRPLAILEAIPALAAPASAVRVLHEAAVTGVHAAIRLTTGVVGGTLDAVLDAADGD